MAAQLKINRRGWLAWWLQQRRHGRCMFAAPVLAAQYPSQLVWNWDFRNPFRWNVYYSPDSGVTYQLDGWLDGDARQYAPDGGSQLMLIVGVDAYGNEVTQRSNAVRPDDAVAPVPNSIPGLQLWVRVESVAGVGDGAAITSWPDESGSENPLLQPAAGLQPLFMANGGGQPSVVFDGEDDLMATAATVFDTDTFQIFLVCRPMAPDCEDAVGTGDVSDGDVLLMVYGDRIRGHVFRSGQSNLTDGTTTIHDGAFCLIEQEVNDSNLVLRLNGNDETTQALTGDMPDARKPVFLGSRGNSYYFNGYVCALLVYQGTLSAPDAARLRQFLFTAYSIPLPYPPAP
jgi:hypothetical protein